MNFQTKNNDDQQLISSENENEDQSLVTKDHLNDLDNGNDDFKFKEENFNVHFFKSLNQFREDELFCDISIKIDQQIIKAHKVVIATIPYFYHMFSSRMIENQTNEVEIKEKISFLTFSKIIDYAYSGEITLNLDNVQEICIASSFLCIKSVLNASINFIIKHLNHSNVLEYKSFSEYLVSPKLEKHIEEFINEEFSMIYKTDDFLELTYEEIKKIISNNEINVEEEKIVFEAMIHWIKADESNRKQYLCSLLEQIRLPFISSEYVVDHIISESLIKQCLKCRDLIDEAKDYHLLPQRRNLIQNHRTLKRSFAAKKQKIIAIGCSEGKTTYFEIYDTLRDEWKIYLTENRQLKMRTSITVLKNQCIFIGGYENGQRTSNVEIFNLNEKKWSQIASLNKKRSALASVVLDNYVYALGGYDGSVTLNLGERYCPKLNKWQYTASMNKCRCSSAAVVCNNSIYVIGGHNGLSIFRSMERYVPNLDQWIACKDMQKERCRLGATSLNGLIYVAGGFSGQIDENSFECYNPSTDSWKSLSPMLKPRTRFSLIANSRNKIYAIGGHVENDLSTCEVYDVETDKWSFINSLIKPNKYHPSSPPLYAGSIYTSFNC